MSILDAQLAQNKAADKKREATNAKNKAAKEAHSSTSLNPPAPSEAAESQGIAYDMLSHQSLPLPGPGTVTAWQANNAVMAVDTSSSLSSLHPPWNRSIASELV